MSDKQPDDFVGPIVDDLRSRLPLAVKETSDADVDTDMDADV